jgi:transposase-like protein
MKTTISSYQLPRFPSEIISHAVWLHYRFCLSFREVEELLAERGITVTSESIPYSCHKFGPDFAHAGISSLAGRNVRLKTCASGMINTLQFGSAS